jgi:protein arginine kinase
MTNKWYEQSGNDSDVAVSTRARLARNIKGYPFPGKMTDKQRREILDKVGGIMTGAAGGREFTLSRLDEGDKIKTNAMVEKHLISPNMTKDTGPRGVILSGDEHISVMVNEEDHLRIQALAPGFCPWDCIREVEKVDKLISGGLEFAFDERLGYLTHCPTNLGTGLRVSVMLHLPALTETGRIKGIIDQADKLGIAVRGIYGEGSKAEGCLYQISNQITLGITESEIVRQVENTVTDIINQERTARQRLYRENPTEVEDRAWRAAAVLSCARKISTDEAMRLLSDLRMGAALGIIKGVDTGKINGLINEIQPAAICDEAGAVLSDGDRDKHRAELIRKEINTELLK